MALAVLILQDLPDGNVAVRAHCEPALLAGEQPTKVQGALMLALNAMDQAKAPMPDNAAGTPLDS